MRVNKISVLKATGILLITAIVYKNTLQIIGSSSEEEVRAPSGQEIIKKEELVGSHYVMPENLFMNQDTLKRELDDLKEDYEQRKIAEQIALEEEQARAQKEEELRKAEAVAAGYSGNTYNLTPSEREMLASLLYLEARGESIECQKMVMSTIFNRYEMGRGSFYDIVYAPNQFSPAKHISSTTPTQTQYDIVDEISSNGSILPTYVMYFRMSYHHSWSGYTGYTMIDDTYFGYNYKDKVALEGSY